MKKEMTVEIPFGDEGYSVLSHLRNLFVHPLGEGMPHNDLSLSTTTGIRIPRLRKILAVFEKSGFVSIERSGNYRWFIWIEGEGLQVCEKMMKAG
ncbi:MAG: hypothetical protein A3G34_13850 [Candidatus Lindowbacteria bacterium RIFCSPLOWO2_12_FULL_62_27]|nr:MAG: hypothetical protein A3I06_03995 [Candidatus Lindowbacteria bacterium RIFCSPLOWO2_02_FULL_62_12]OGH62659.1 MAG: hypothetical protein A3G34_13850 [Candidatus Lindowbacteria bacterium RIFCSPLOWO2_12_FULL_62_27]